MIKNYIFNNPQLDIKYECIQNSGPGKARNVGIDLATGDYICFLDSDDRYNLNLFEELNKVLKPTDDICFFGWEEVDEKGHTFSKYDERFEFLNQEYVSGISAVELKFYKKIWICNCNEVY